MLLKLPDAVSRWLALVEEGYRTMKGFAGVLATVAATAALMTTSLSAFAIPFDLEGVPLGPYPMVSVSDGGLTLTITAEGDAPRIEIQFPEVGLLGDRSAIGFADSLSFAPMRFVFSTPLDSVTFAFGDAGGDDDSPYTISAFTEDDILLGVVTGDYPDGFSSGKTEVVEFDNASYYIVSGGALGANPSSIYFEVIAYAPRTVPEPGALALTVIGLAGIAVTRRKRIAN